MKTLKFKIGDRVKFETADVVNTLKGVISETRPSIDDDYLVKIDDGEYYFAFESELILVYEVEGFEV